jgi:GNAT superfamily N-acetyltransferase
VLKQHEMLSVPLSSIQQPILWRDCARTTAHGYRFHIINLRELPKEQLEILCQQCEQVEHACWNAQEAFPVYFRRHDVLAYVVWNNAIVGFLLVSHWLDNEIAVYALEEMMILEDHRGQGFWKPLMGLVHHFMLEHYAHNQQVKLFCSIFNTCNPGLMFLSKKYAHLCAASNFSPNDRIIDVANQYILNNQLVALQPDSPFFLKASFPNCSKIAFRKSSKALKNILPAEFNFRRGDSLLAISFREIETERLFKKNFLSPIQCGVY